MNQLSFLDDDPPASSPVDWSPTRSAGIARQEYFVPYAGRAYARARNFDLAATDRTNISCLSPWIRHRLILEQEVVASTLAKHTFAGAEKFLQEVFWRSYFKGWLEQHPAVWMSYRRELRRSLDQLEQSKPLRARYEDAITGRTGIECFDAWARELVELGYLHNHARMWFASIWIFTLRLPWQLGADFFYRHLLDGDPASNTLSWRWVGGLHTKGKTYLARPSNIARFTNNRFDPTGQLATVATALKEPDSGPSISLPSAEHLPIDVPYGLLITEEDCHVESLKLKRPPSGLIALAATNRRSSLPIGEPAQAFARGAVEDGVARAETHFLIEKSEISDLENGDRGWGKELIVFALRTDVKLIATAYAPVGPVAEELAAARTVLAAAGIRLIEVRRPYDDAAWPHATKGFFKLKAQIPKLISVLN